MSKVTQEQAILARLRNGHSITPIYALRHFGCFRLGARVWDLRQAGHKIISRMVERGGKHVAQYSLEVK